MNNTIKIEKVISKIIIPQYPELSQFEVKDLFEDMYDSGTPLGKQMLGRQYVVEFITSECLDTKKQMEIDTEVKSLFVLLSPDVNTLNQKTPKISCFFDCEDGEGFVFNSEYGYHH
jgi:hypothetical protein